LLVLHGVSLCHSSSTEANPVQITDQITETR
jgi:hypothetical protein